MFSWKDKSVFVTGANGFLGSHLIKKLIKMGVKPVALVYEENPGSIFDKEDLASKSHVVEGDIRDLSLINKVLDENKIEIVFHLAAQAIVDQAIDNPLDTFESNVQGTWNILEAVTRSKTAQKIIVASSDKAYGHHNVLPYKEDSSSLVGVYPYEVSKTCADMISQSYWKSFKTPVCITRATNLYGPGDLKFNRIVPGTIKNLYEDKSPIIRDTAKASRDYLFVEDVADGYLLLAEKMNQDLFGHAFNFSTNIPSTTGEAIKLITEEFKKSHIKPKTIETDGFEIDHQYACYEKARELLGWEPKHSFAEGVRKTIPWYVSHLNGE